MLKPTEALVLGVFLAGLTVHVASASEAGESAEAHGSKALIEPPSSSRDASPDNAADLESLLAVIEEETQIATKTKMNADFVPGIVTVLHGEDLEALGVRDVWEALGYAPGLETTINMHGQKLVLVRGVGYSFNSAHTKIMVDSVARNHTASGFNFQALSIPIELVDRIEIVRGPGSSLYGEFAYAGVINIVTRQESRKVFMSGGSYDTWRSGASYTWKSPSQDYGFHVDLVKTHTDGADLNSGPDLYYTQGHPELSNAPESANALENLGSAGLRVHYHDFSAAFFYEKQSFGEYFGPGRLPPVSDREVNTFTTQGVVLQQDFHVSDVLAGKLQLQGMRHTADTDDAYLASFPGPAHEEHPEGQLMDALHKERRMEGNLEMVWTGLSRHTLLTSLTYTRVELLEEWFLYNTSLVNGGRPQPNNFIVPETLPTRDIFSIAVQDQYQLSPVWTFTYGGRYDRYSDAGDNFSPRLAAVWRINEHHILKAQYAEAFRPPTFFELSGAPHISFASGPEQERSSREEKREDDRKVKPETIATYELGYIYRLPSTVVRATAFYSKLEDLIEFIRGEYRNLGEVDIRGLEIEVEHRFGTGLKLQANATYSDSEDQQTNKPLPGSSQWYGNVTMQGRLLPKTFFGLHYRYVGDRARYPGDSSSDKLDGYHRVDVSFTRRHCFAQGVTARLGVHNLLDADIRALSLPGTYVEGLPRSGRTWWAQIAYEF